MWVDLVLYRSQLGLNMGVPPQNYNFRETKHTKTKMIHQLLEALEAALRSGVAGRDFRGRVRAQRQVEAAGGLHLDRSHRRLGAGRDLGTRGEI